ncbi:MAG: hypothetical protein E5V70_06295, partial [Mesorhizobium sp.]
ARNRTGVQGFAVLCVTTPPRGLIAPGVPPGSNRLRRKCRQAAMVHSGRFPLDHDSRIASSTRMLQSKY